MSPEERNQLIAEHAEPAAGPSHVPVWLFTLLTVLIFCAGMYMELYGGGYNSQVYEPFKSPGELAAVQPPTAGGGVITRGRDVYNLYCLPCHQASGMGSPGLNPPLAGSEWVNAEGPNRIIRLVLNGIEGPIEVSGKQYNGAMPPWRGTIPNEDIAAVLTYIRQEWGNKAPPVTVEQVNAVDEATKGRTTPWTAAELLALPVSE